MMVGYFYYYCWCILAPICHAKNSFYEYSETLGKIEEKFIEQASDDVQPVAKGYQGQIRQDQVVFELFKRKGYFVDLAANHYVKISNSYYLEQHQNWTGICIEPNPMYLRALVFNRKCNVFVNPVGRKTGERVTFRMRNVYGGIVGAKMDNTNKGNSSNDVTLSTVTLTDILRYFNAPKVMEFLSLDVEGAEELVMEGFDFESYVFLTMAIERPTESLHRILASHGYVFWMRLSNWGDVFYLHSSIESFKDIMRRTPPALKTTKWKRKDHKFLLDPLRKNSHTAAPGH